MKKKIILADDEIAFLDATKIVLEMAGYEVAVAVDRKSLFDLISEQEPDIILLDVVLGQDSGFEIIISIRSISRVPVIMLTGMTSENDRVVGLELGSDDYVTKPFSSAELIARIKAVLRRTGSNEVRPKKNVASFVGWKFDILKKELISPNGSVVILTPGEYLVLEILVRNSGNAIERHVLLSSIGRTNSNDRSIDVQIMRLRKKISAQGNFDYLIQSVRSKGYVFCEEIVFS
ncbi:MAG: response regulator transcription factor [Sneathiella sp.]